ncbi:PREDICTED: uncharacterized protein LOC106785571 [Polistes canadensis]|uniref:uncharacterized protein LOC106785571 n=1 Tax=Polistes canadensis TaxID=91411 RepID=UPI0007190022|nr:PREDICTED: uncharacterized protein LOC106785571 [Polistes canadensis]XP_014601665.1 PREDICTED: uncharacterized protein LOC106785571 [Polistes canadensis]
MNEKDPERKMHYQPQISTISTAAPPSYSEAINQQPPSKNNFPLPPFGTHTYEAHIQPEIGQYPTTSNYQGYNASQPPYNPTYMSMETNPPQTYIVTNAVVHRKNRNVTCSSCLKILIFSIIIVSITSYLLKVIIASISN